MGAVLSRLFIGVLGLVLGGALGVYTTLQTDPTPFTQADLDRAGSSAATPSEVSTGTDDAVAEVAVELDTARDRLSRMQASGKAVRSDLEEADARVAELEKTVATLRAETAAIAQNAVSDAAKQERLAAQTTVVAGTVTTTVALGQRFKPWPKDCTSIVARVSVRVLDADGTLVTTAPLTDSSVTRSSVSKDVLTFTCSASYEATLPAPRSESYGFQAVDITAADQPLGKSEADGDALDEGDAPDLAVKICPGC